jgi:hypothetical protein
VKRGVRLLVALSSLGMEGARVPFAPISEALLPRGVLGSQKAVVEPTFCRSISPPLYRLCSERQRLIQSVCCISWRLSKPASVSGRIKPDGGRGAERGEQRRANG